MGKKNIFKTYPCHPWLNPSFPCWEKNSRSFVQFADTPLAFPEKKSLFRFILRASAVQGSQIEKKLKPKNVDHG